MEALLSRVVEELRSRHDCHTVILYGSYARGDQSAISDIDVLGIRAAGEAVRDARLWQGVYLDAFIYPEAILDTFDEGMARILGGRILLQRDAIGRQLLERVEALIAQGPEPADPAEIQVRLTWARKMVGRIGQRDVEGNYRRHWLLFQLLEDYFYLRGLWFHGSKESFKWMKSEDPFTFQLFEAALEPGASDETLQGLVERMHVIGLPSLEAEA